MVFQDVNIPFLYVIIIINIWLFYSFSLNKHNEKVYNEVFMMNTRTLEQFDAMDVDMLTAVEGGNWGQCICRDRQFCTCRRFSWCWYWCCCICPCC
ncbi:hypothetical protein SMU21_04836 [Streptococcus mutans 1SM1]|nr:hypothetical protein SMU21_04836 [Streptococcus mutans 1SM1]